MSDAADIFTRLGGARALAALIGEPPSTVQSWKAAKRIPAQKQPLVIERARAAGHLITAEDVVWPMGAATANEAAA